MLNITPPTKPCQCMPHARVKGKLVVPEGATGCGGVEFILSEVHCNIDQGVITTRWRCQGCSAEMELHQSFEPSAPEVRTPSEHTPTTLG